MHVIELAGLSLVPHISGALFVPSHETLVISDLHLEQGTSLARRGLHVPPYDTSITLELLATVLSAHVGRRVIFLGDSFHDSQGEERLNDEQLAKLCAILKPFETVWITGNHDPHPPQRLGGQGAEEISLGPLTLRHEPQHKLVDRFEICGHLHPGCSVSQRGRLIRGKCFIADHQRLIMPAFGAYTGGLSVSSKAFAGLFDKARTKVWMIGQENLHRFSLEKISSS